MPLPPIQRITLPIGGLNLNGAVDIAVIHRNGDLAATLGCIKEMDSIQAGLFYVHGVFNPFTRHGPTHVQHAQLRLDKIEWIIVAPAILRISGIHGFIYPELVQVASISRIQPAAAMVHRVGVMVRHPFTAKIIVRAPGSPADHPDRLSL